MVMEEELIPALAMWPVAETRTAVVTNIISLFTYEYTYVYDQFFSFSFFSLSHPSIM